MKIIPLKTRRSSTLGLPWLFGKNRRNRPASSKQHMAWAHIKEQSRLSLGSYGRPRMTEELKELGVDVGHWRVGRLMRENGIVVEREVARFV